MLARLKSDSVFSNPGFPLAVQFHRVQADSMGLHGHEFTELVIIASGLGRHVTDIDAYPIMAGDVFVILRGQAHGYRNTESLSLYNILFKEDELNLPEHDLRELVGYHALFSLEPRFRQQHQFQSRLRLNLDQLAHTTGLLEAMRKDLEARPAGYRCMGVAYLLQLVCYLSRCYSRVRMPASRPLLRIGAAIAYMEANYEDNISLADLARKAHMSERSLLRAFQESLGLAPIDYLIRLRVHKAADLMRREDTRVTEAAFAVGFSDSNYFSRQFKRIMGMTPSAYRRQAGVFA